MLLLLLLLVLTFNSTTDYEVKYDLIITAVAWCVIGYVTWNRPREQVDALDVSS